MTGGTTFRVFWKCLLVWGVWSEKGMAQMGWQSLFLSTTRGICLALILVAALGGSIFAAPFSDEPVQGAISGEVYIDGDADSARQPQEAGVPNARVTLRTISTGAVVKTTTDVDGYYLFLNLEIGTYEVVVVPPPGYIVIANGTQIVHLGEAGAPLVISTSLRFGLFLPQISR